MASFKEAFAAARKELGAGKTFMWKGKSYSTNYAEENKKPAKKEFSTDMVSKAIDKAQGIKSPKKGDVKPKARPVDTTPKPVAAVQKITVSTLPSPKKQPATPKSSTGGPARYTPQPAAPKSSTGGPARYTPGTGSVSYSEWKKMTREQRKSAGLPVQDIPNETTFNNMMSSWKRGTKK